jgi:pimeloyl-ACP methyl ester carboxylesterase
VRPELTRWTEYDLASALLGAVAGAAALCRVMLVPGAFGDGTSSLFIERDEYFADYRAFFEAKRCEVKKAEFPPDATIEERALILKDQAGRFSRGGKGPLTLVAHSQGGLDARFALKTLGLSRVGILVTIGTPHSGAKLGKWVLEHRSRGSLLYWLLRIFARYDLRELSFAGEMTPEFLQKFLSRFEAVPGVRYASAQGVCRTGCHRSLTLLSKWVGIGAGDGLVEGSSQLWGDDLGVYDLDHIDEVGASLEKRQERGRFLQAAWKYLGIPE